MGTPKEGEKPHNIVPVSLRRAPEQGRFHGVKTPEAMKQQAADAARKAGTATAKEFLGKRWGSTVFENPIRVQRPNWPKNPGEQRGEVDPSQPNAQGRQPVEEAENKPSEPEYSQERIEEARKTWPDLTTEQIIYRLKDADQRAEDKRLGRRRGFTFS